MLFQWIVLYQLGTSDWLLEHYTCHSCIVSSPDARSFPFYPGAGERKCGLVTRLILAASLNPFSGL